MKSKNIIEAKTLVRIKETVLIYLISFFIAFTLLVWFDLSQNSFYLIRCSIMALTMLLKGLDYIKLLFSKK